MATPRISPAQVRELLDYDPSTGVFVWKHRGSKWFPGDEHHRKIWNNRFAGKVAGNNRKDGYTVVVINYVRYTAHRLAWAHVYGEWPKNEIDHIDGDRSNTRIANLRDVVRRVNQENLKRSRGETKSGLLGVTWDKKKNKWFARIKAGGRARFLGYFSDPNKAHEVYLKAKVVLHEGYAP